MLLETAFGKTAFGKTYIVPERKKARGRKKKVQKDRNLSESISVMEIKIQGYYLGKGSLKFQFNF